MYQDFFTTLGKAMFLTANKIDQARKGGKGMGIAIEEIENEIINLPQDQLRKFRAWYEAFDSNVWDEQIEHDVVAGKLDALANAAVADHNAGRSTTL